MRGVGAALVIIASLGCAGSLDPSVAWRRYWYSMNSRPGDASIAGGAIDQTFAFTGAIALTIGQASRARAADGQPSGKAGATAEEGTAEDGETSDE